ncbi:MAG: GumC family protein [Cyanophyceae cyanobacterium]
MSKQTQDFQLDEAEEFYEAPNRPNFNRYFKIFRRKAVLIAGITGLSTLVAWLVTLREPFYYAGKFRVLLEPVTSAEKLTEPSTLARTGGVPNEELLSVDYPTQLEILRGPGMLLEIAEQVQSQEPTVDVSSLLGSLQDNLSVQRVGGETRRDDTKILEVTYTGVDPKLTQLVLEAAAQQYLDYSIEERQTRISAGVGFIDEQVPELQERLSELQAQQKQLQQEYQLIDPNSRGQELFSQVHRLTEQQLEVQTQLQELKTLRDTLQAKLNLSPEEAMTASSLSQDPNRAALRSQLQEVESQIAVNSARFTADNPILQELQEQRQNLIDLLDAKTEQIIEQSPISVDDRSPALGFQDNTRLALIKQLVDTTNQIQVLESRYQSLTESKTSYENQAQDFPEVVRRYNDLESQEALTKQILDQLLTQRETLRVEVAQNEVPWELLGEPRIARNEDGEPKAFPPDSTRILVAGAMAGVLLGSAAAILLEKRQDIFYKPQDVQDSLALPLLGEIPIDDRYSSPKSTASIFAKDGDGFFTESFESLYTKLSFLFTDPSVRSLVVSSVEPQEGQTTVAVYLAKIAATAGKRVLLVDANLQEPQLHTWLNVKNYRGLNQLLSGQLPDEKYIQQTEIDNLNVLTTGAAHPHGSKLWSTQMELVMETLQAQYDLVIYDPPHFFDSTGINFLAARTDGILLVLEIAKTSRSLVKKAVEQINAFRLPVLGVVTNEAVPVSDSVEPLDVNQSERSQTTVGSRIANDVDVSPT